MESKRGLAGKWGLMAAVLLLQLFMCTWPGYAETTWNDVAGSINNSFSGHDAFSAGNILGFLFITLVILGVALVFRYLWAAEQKEVLKKLRNKIVLRPLGRQNKRYYYRMRINMEFEWIIAAEAEKRKVRYKKDSLVDISGGGLCFRASEKLNPGDQLKLRLDTGAGEPLILDGLIVRVEEEPGPDNVMYRVSVQFGKIVEGDRDKIIAMISRRQRDAIQKQKQEGAVSLPENTPQSTSAVSLPAIRD